MPRNRIYVGASSYYSMTRKRIYVAASLTMPEFTSHFFVYTY